MELQSLLRPQGKEEAGCWLWLTVNDLVNQVSQDGASIKIPKTEFIEPLVWRTCGDLGRVAFLETVWKLQALPTQHTLWVSPIWLFLSCAMLYVLSHVQLCGPVDHSPPGSCPCDSPVKYQSHKNPLASIYPQETLSTQSLGGKSLSSMIHNSQKVKIILSLRECIHKIQYYLDNRTLLNNEKNKRWAHTSQHGWTSKTEWKKVRRKSPSTDRVPSFI